MRKWFVIFSLSLLFIGCESKKEPTVFFVRHAEKDSFNPKDPSLTLDGVMRSVDLQKWFEGMHVDIILSSNTTRTLETAKPLAEDQSKEIGIYDPMNFEEFADQLKSMKADTIVVIGHSNTILPQIEALGLEKRQENIGENEYNKLFQVSLSDKKVTVMEYGSKSN